MSEQATAEARALEQAQMRVDAWYAIGLLDIDTADDPAFARAVAAYGREREREALERAAKAICQDCAEGFGNLEWRGANHGYWVHRDAGIDFDCEASAIRALVGSVDRAEAGEGK
jgi:hypothetical protein